MLAIILVSDFCGWIDWWIYWLTDGLTNHYYKALFSALKQISCAHMFLVLAGLVLCFHNSPNSDTDERIFDVCM